MLQAPLFREHDIVTVLPSLSNHTQYSMIPWEQLTSVSPTMECQADTRHAIDSIDTRVSRNCVYYRFVGDHNWYWVDCMTTEGMRISKYLNLDFAVSRRRRIVG